MYLSRSLAALRCGVPSSPIGEMTKQVFSILGCICSVPIQMDDGGVGEVNPKGYPSCRPAEYRAARALRLPLELTFDDWVHAYQVSGSFFMIHGRALVPAKRPSC